MVLLARRNWSRFAALHEGILLVLVVGFAACGSSVIVNHPLPYTGQLVQNSTAVEQLEPSSSEDYASANQTQAAATVGGTAGDYPSTDDGPGPDRLFTVTESDIPVTTLLLNSSIEESNLTEYNVTDNSSSEGYKMADFSSTTFTTGIIVGICLLVIIVAVLVGAISYMLYRHSLWNRPQTLSDKCSNDESTGYIDDTFRENSEEMYSLDNDSFLNSLEAMTIQNYWTDHVKHTKL